MRRGHLKRRIVRIAAVLLAAGMLAGCARGDARAAYQRGCVLLDEQDYEGAAAKFEEVIGTGLYLPEAYRSKGLAEMLLADFSDACISFEKSLLYIESQSESFRRDVNLYLAYCRERQGQSDKTLAIYNEMLARGDDAEILYLRGRLNLKNGDTKAAKNDFNRAVSIAPDYDLYINIYKLYRDEDRSGDGSVYLEQALEEASRNMDDYYSRGLVNYYLQNYEEAKNMLIQALRLDPDDAGSVYLLGQVYLASDDVANARAVYREHADSAKGAARAYNGLALCDMAEGEYESALENIKKGLDLEDPEAAQGLLYNEIVVYEKMKDWTTARSKAAAYVSKYPADESGMKEYEFLSTR